MSSSDVEVEVLVSPSHDEDQRYGDWTHNEHNETDLLELFHEEPQTLLVEAVARFNHEIRLQLDRQQRQLFAQE